MNQLRKAARAVVLQVADDAEVPMEALDGFASLTLRCELVHLAQRLVDALPEFAVRGAMELASLPLTLEMAMPVSQGASRGDQTS